MIIRNYNAICNLGNNIDEIFRNAIEGVRINFSSGKFPVKSKLPEILEEDYNIRANRLLLAALKPLEPEKLDKLSTAIVVATTNSGVDEYEISRNPKHYQLGNPAGFVRNFFGFKNFYTSVSTACSSGNKAFKIAEDLLNSGVAQTVIVIGVDSFAKVPFYGFSALEIFSKEYTNPFSENRCGINIGEGAAAFILTKEGAGIEFAGYGETTDCFHPTTPEPEGIEAEHAIRQALTEVGGADKIDYINLHGTGTPANDLMEARAVWRIFGDKVPASSTKPLTGHCLGASAAIEAALCCKLLESDSCKVFPHIYDGKYDKKLPPIWLAGADTHVKEIKTCLSLSFGFGGTNTALVLRRTF